MACKSLSKENTNCLKGIFSLFVLLHHLYQHTEILQINYVTMVFFQNMGYLSVSVFFFFSGYGLMKQYSLRGKAYLQGFAQRRIVPLYVNYLFMLLVYTAVDCFVYGKRLNIVFLLRSLTWGGTFVRNGWYIQTIVLLYIVFGLVFRGKLKDNIKLWIMTLFLVFYCVFCTVMNINVVWYQAVFAFSVGMLWVINEDHILKLFDSHYIYCFVMMSALWGMSMLLGVTGIAGEYYIVFKMISAAVFPVLVVLIAMKVSITNRFTALLGRYFFEIYVCQGLVMEFWHSDIVYLKNDIVYIFVVIITLAVLAYGVNAFFQKTALFMKRAIHVKK